MENELKMDKLIILSRKIVKAVENEQYNKENEVLKILVQNFY